MESAWGSDLPVNEPGYRRRAAGASGCLCAGLPVRRDKRCGDPRNCIKQILIGDCDHNVVNLCSFCDGRRGGPGRFLPPGSGRFFPSGRGVLLPGVGFSFRAWGSPPGRKSLLRGPSARGRHVSARLPANSFPFTLPDALTIQYKCPDCGKKFNHRPNFIQFVIFKIPIALYNPLCRKLSC